ncbi:MAG: hypothetical protein NVS3B18_15060 [Candidatus Dormibacteria bacterium]
MLMAIPGPPVLEAETVTQVQALMAKGLAGSVFLTTDDCRGDYETLSRQGVEFVEAPETGPTASTPASGIRRATTCA